MFLEAESNQSFPLASKLYSVSSNLGTLTFVIPCFNEYGNLPKLFDLCAKISEETNISFILVNNGSTDHSEMFFSSHAHPKISVLSLDINQGYGNGLWEGIKLVKTDFVGWLHADQAKLLTNFGIPRELATNLNMFHKGTRLNRDLKEVIISRSMGYLCSSILKVKLRDINAQPNIYPRRFISTIASPPKDFSFDMYIYTKALRGGLTENRFDVIIPKRIKGNSSWNTGFLSIAKMSLRTISAAHKFRSYT